MINEMVILKDTGVIIKNLNGEILTKEVHTIEWSPDMAEKHGFDHFMLKEIHEQSDAVKNTLMEESEIKEVVNKFEKFQRICFVACGTSYHASYGW